MADADSLEDVSRAIDAACRASGLVCELRRDALVERLLRKAFPR